MVFVVHRFVRLAPVTVTIAGVIAGSAACRAQAGLTPAQVAGIDTIVWGAVLLLAIVLLWRGRGQKGRRSRSGPGPGAMGAVYGMLQEDKRKAIEIIVEGRAEQTDPEHADGTPHPRRGGQPPQGR